MLVRVGRQVQEVPRPLSGGGSRPTVLRVVLIGLVGLVAVGGYAAYRIWDQAGRDERPAADAIVVMGAAQYDGRPSPVFAARLDHAIDLYREGVAPRLIVTGGKREGDRTTEAASAREYMLRHDVPEDAILAEDTSRTTLQSIRGVEALMKGSRAAQRGLRVGPDAHAARPADGRGRGHRRLRLADPDQSARTRRRRPDRCDRP